MTLAESTHVKLVFNPASPELNTPSNFTVEVFAVPAVMRIRCTNYRTAQAIYDNYRGKKI